jgi:hypothetical protein
MNVTTESSALAGKHKDTLNLHVRYLGSRKPYVYPHAAVTTTLGDLKPPVLLFFNLTETGTKVYFFTLDGTPLNDPTVSVGSLAQGHHELKLDLVEQLIQG